MKQVRFGNTEDKTPRFQRITWLVLTAFCLVSAVLALLRGDGKNAALAAGTVLLVSLPRMLGYLYGLQMVNWLYFFVSIYAVGPLLGTFYKLYYHTVWWDDLLHLAGGVIFALVGWYWVCALNGRVRNTLIMCGVFAVCFSVTVAAGWEMIEFCIDRLFAMDMQVDTVVNTIHSYHLGTQPGVRGTIAGITDVAVNGTPLGLNGYLDLGLTDTIRDMFVETVGAILCAEILIWDRARHVFLFRKEGGR